MVNHRTNQLEGIHLLETISPVREKEKDHNLQGSREAILPSR